MTDHPIIFSAPMVRALLDGRKTMTRRLAWRTRKHLDGQYKGRADERVAEHWQKVKPGDRLWVRESARRNPRLWVYAADAAEVGWPGRKRLAGYQRNSMPSIHLPRVASRLTLTVTATKIERLHEISAADVRAEGLIAATTRKDGPGADEDLISQFEELWTRLHGEGAWDANPEVVALTFTVHHRNIDAEEIAA